MKTCKTCKEDKPLLEYYKTPDGYYYGTCKCCHIGKVRKHRETYAATPRSREKKREYRRKWLQTDAGRMWNTKRCAKRRNADPVYHNLKRAARDAGTEISILLVVKERDKGCRLGGATEDLQIDHIFPQSLGGLGTENNLQMLCRDCNLFKSDNLLLPNGGIMIVSADLKRRLVGVVRKRIPGFEET